MTNGQSKVSSFLEANVNTFIGFLVTLIFSPAIYHLVGIAYTGKQLWLVTLLFTLLSVARGYIIRRFFNKKEAKNDAQLLFQIENLKTEVSTLKHEKLNLTLDIAAIKNDQLHMIQDMIENTRELNITGS